MVSGEGDITGLDTFPTVLGLADGPAPASAMGALTPSTNWAGNVVWREPLTVSPETLAELRAVVREAEGNVRVIGRSHSFTPMCDTDGTLINMAKMSGVIDLDETTGRVTVEGGITCEFWRSTGTGESSRAACCTHQTVALTSPCTGCASAALVCKPNQRGFS